MKDDKELHNDISFLAFFAMAYVVNKKEAIEISKSFKKSKRLKIWLEDLFTDKPKELGFQQALEWAIAIAKDQKDRKKRCRC